MGCRCWTHVYFLEVSRHCLTVAGSWFGLIFNASFLCLGRAIVLTPCRAEEGTVLVMAQGAEQQFGAVWLGQALVGSSAFHGCHRRAVVHLHGVGRTRLADSSTAAGMGPGFPEWSFVL